MKKWVEAVFAALLLAGWMIVANTADGALRANDAARAAAASQAELLAAASNAGTTRASPPGR